MKLEAEVGGTLYPVEIDGRDGRYEIDIAGKKVQVDARAMEGFFTSVLVGGSAYEVTVEPDEEAFRVQVGIEAIRVEFLDPLRPVRTGPGHGAPRAGTGRRSVTSLMPGRIVRVLVEAGQEVESGQGLVVVEAMKMENEVASPASGRVLELRVAPGDNVEAGTPLVTIG